MGWRAGEKITTPKKPPPFPAALFNVELLFFEKYHQPDGEYRES
jgi:hypothetical protein